jgi:hypothetical protein
MMAPSAAYMAATVQAITSAMRSGSTTIADTLTRIALAEGVPRADVQAAIAAGRPTTEVGDAASRR